MVFAGIQAEDPQNGSAPSVRRSRAGKRRKKKGDRAAESRPSTAVLLCVCACTGGRALVPARIWPRNHDRLCLVFARILARGPANASASSVSGWRAGKRPKEKHDRAPDSPPPTAVLLGVHACTCTGEGGRCPGEDLAKKSRPARPGLRTHSSRGPTERVGALGSTIARREASQKEGRPGRRRPFC